ncbi:hypothetical protein ABK046_52465, partial [Streptomyces caeruleatus]
MSAQRREKPDWIADPCESQHTLSSQSRDNRFIRYERGAQHEAAALHHALRDIVRGIALADHDQRVGA